MNQLELKASVMLKIHEKSGFCFFLADAQDTSQSVGQHVQRHPSSTVSSLGNRAS